jgi:hypothetical protein
MHAVGALIHQDSDGRVPAGIGAVLCHFLHDALIAADTLSSDRKEVTLNRSTSTRFIIAIPLSLPDCLRSSPLVLEPLTERLDFRRRVRRKKVIDVDVGR